MDAPTCTAVRLSRSASVNSRERMRKRTPRGISSEKLAPRPGVTSMVSWVCCQYWSGLNPISYAPRSKLPACSNNIWIMPSLRPMSGTRIWSAPAHFMALR